MTPHTTVEYISDQSLPIQHISLPLPLLIQFYRCTLLVNILNYTITSL